MAESPKTKRRSNLGRVVRVALWRTRRGIRHSTPIIGGVILVILPLAGVMWVAGPLGEKTPEFVNFAVKADCHKLMEPVIHIDIPPAGDRATTLVSARADMRVAFQFLDTLSDGQAPACTSFMVFANRELLNPKILVGSGNSAASKSQWFYIDPIQGYEARAITAIPDSNGWGWSVKAAGDQISGFAGVLTFELGDVIETMGLATSTFSMTVLIQSSLATVDGKAHVGASLAIPSDHRLVQDLSIPGPTNVLSTNRGPRYEFTLVESLLGNEANRGRWISLHTVVEDTVWAKWQEYLLFVFSGLFGFAIGFFFESLLARRN